MEIGIPLLIVALLLALAAYRLRRRRIAAAVLAVFAVLLIAGGSYAFWYTHRPIPADEQRELFLGITYIRDVRSEPRPLIVHVVRIDLTAPAIHFRVTPYQRTEGLHLPARTTSQFLDEFDAQIAINGDFFGPWHERGPFDYYPHVGDPVSVYGFASSDGVPYSGDRLEQPVVFISAENEVTFGLPTDDVTANAYNAIAGNIFLVENGQARIFTETHEYIQSVHPRTAVALDESGATLLLFVVDGRQPNYSEGISLPDLANLAVEYGGYTAVNLDGGGSSALVMQGADGQPQTLSSPIHVRIPGTERPVANHLGVYAQPLA